MFERLRDFLLTINHWLNLTFVGWVVLLAIMIGLRVLQEIVRV